TGGSGTRVFARIVRRGGMYIGARLNESEDAVDFGDFSDRWINQFADVRRYPVAVSLVEQMRGELDALLHVHLAMLGGEARAWGWKEPRSIYLLPFFHEAFPNVRFLHVVRDGRDMAYSGNQNQLRKHGAALLTHEEFEL